MDLLPTSNNRSQFTVSVLQKNLKDMNQIMGRLSSGRKINRAADGPAALVISKQLLTQIASLNQEIDNVSQNIGKYRTASQIVGQLRDDLTELRGLAIGAANEGGNSEAAQQAYATSAENLVSSYNLTAATSQYNGQGLLDGSESALADLQQQTEIDLSSAESAVASIEVIDQQMRELDRTLGELGSAEKYDLESKRAYLEVTRNNLVAAESSMADTDYAAEMANLVASQIRTKFSASLLSHSFMSGKEVLKLLDM